MKEAFERARDALARARRVCVLTGAGISAESGVPTFRGPDGFWRSFRPEALATPEAFARDPRLVWERYEWRRRKIAACTPNAGHEALVRLERRICEETEPEAADDRFLLVTQNVDGLHARAGSRRIAELHGNLWRVRCTAFGGESIDERVPFESLPPLSACCGESLRPAVVWFGEPLPPDALSTALGAASACDLLLVVETSSVVYPAASLAPVARRSGATVVEVNPQETALSEEADVVVRASAARALPSLLDG